jgi:tetratricopeptide (TPR) repeat protein
MSFVYFQYQGLFNEKWNLLFWGKFQREGRACMKRKIITGTLAVFVILFSACTRNREKTELSFVYVAETAEDFYGRAHFYRNGDYDRAIADYEAVLRLDPNDANTEWFLEYARQERGW